MRNLTSEEIVGQILVARERLGDFPDAATPQGAIVPAEGRLVSNVVMMGMGEPLYNFDNVKEALLIASDGEGIALSKRRITLSTSGVVPMIPRAGAEMGVMLAISLHAVRDELRDELVPINKKWPLAELLDACRAYPGLSNARRITFEYVMLKGVNDSLAEARDLVRLLKGIPAKINLIPFNPWPGSPYECSDWEQIEAFAEVVNRAGYASPIRTPRGRDILAACGQLKSASERMRKSEREAAGSPSPEATWNPPTSLMVRCERSEPRTTHHAFPSAFRTTFEAVPRAPSGALVVRGSLRSHLTMRVLVVWRRLVTASSGRRFRPPLRTKPNSRAPETRLKQTLPKFVCNKEGDERSKGDVRCRVY